MPVIGQYVLSHTRTVNAFFFLTASQRTLKLSCVVSLKNPKISLINFCYGYD